MHFPYELSAKGYLHFEHVLASEHSAQFWAQFLQVRPSMNYPAGQEHFFLSALNRLLSIQMLQDVPSLQESQFSRQLRHWLSWKYDPVVHLHPCSEESKRVLPTHFSQESLSLHFRQFLAHGVHFLSNELKWWPSWHGLHFPFSITNG